MCCASSRTCASWSWASRRHEKSGHVVKTLSVLGCFSLLGSMLELEIHYSLSTPLWDFLIYNSHPHCLAWNSEAKFIAVETAVTV